MEAKKKVKAPELIPVVSEATYLASVTVAGAFPPPVCAEIAFAGRSNVGKSSLINTLVARKHLARISGTPGCTRAVNFFHLGRVDGLTFRLVDLPGYGYAKRSKGERASWGPLLESYLAQRVTLRAVVMLVDVRRGFEEEENDLLNFLQTPSTATRLTPKVIAVATKLDKLPLAQRKLALSRAAPPGIPVVGFSSVTREGVATLWHRLEAALDLKIASVEGQTSEESVQLEGL